jgi:hypothetical protein
VSYRAFQADAFQNNAFQMDALGGAEVTMFMGVIRPSRPTSGLFDEAVVEVEAHDWMGYLSTQELGLQPVVTDHTFDLGIGIAMAAVPIPPEIDFETGEMPFTSIFDSDTRRTSLMSFFEKMARNEWGRIWVGKDGVLHAENRIHRWGWAEGDLFTIDGEMSELETGFEPTDIVNNVQLRAFPANFVDEIVKVGEINGAPPILAGETMVVTVEFVNPDDGQQMSAWDVENPVADANTEFGSVQNFTSDDMSANLVQNNEVGAHSMICRLTNTHATDTGYLNGFDIQGKRLLRGEPITVEAKDQGSIDDYGENRLTVTLEHINDPGLTWDYGNYILSQAINPHLRVERIVFVADQSDDLTGAAVLAEVSQRFAAAEDLTGLNESFFISRLRYTYIQGILVCELIGPLREI